ncbi:cache domain-containing protein [Marinomonas ostreistagni]|uniref:sensor domain-containing diguanylate cyclase n=1 Tax=Marinomonas ostreistagni TaxID=359209 RepID=UPI00194F47DE|nr:cache domain-containing protein [Marinomonas ostreistagni]MBM6550859.1 cache domain-containing protein [Marinomonas ostreistagni]
MRKKRLSVFVFYNIVLIGAFAIALTSLLWINNIYQTYQSDSKRIRDDYTQQVKDELKTRVDALVSYIDYRRSQTDTRLRADIKSRVLEIKALINTLYTQNQGKMSTAALQELIIETVRGMRFNEGRGYYFIASLDGNIMLNPVMPALEGYNLLDQASQTTQASMLSEIELVQTQQQGFIEGYWQLPFHDDTKQYKKISYLHEFAPYNWYFGAGEYSKISTQQLQQEIQSYINQLSYGVDGNQYIFIHDFEGTELANGRFPELIGKNYYTDNPAPGIDFIGQQIDIAKNPPHQGFLTLAWPHASQDTFSDKLMYINAVPEWDWAIGSGADLDALNRQISNYQDALYQQLLSGIYKVLLLAGGLLLLSVLAARYVYKRMNDSVQLFIRNLEHNNAQLSLINEDEVAYEEFKALAHTSNQTTERINHLLQHDELTGLYNRRHITALLETLLKQAQQQQAPLSIVMLDIDHFKAINDNYGHPFGDEVLKKVAECIKSEVRDQGHVGRFGGEELVLLLPHYGPRQAYEIAMHIKQCVATIRLPGQEHPVTISGGISSNTMANQSDLIQQADKNLYRAKRNGRNRIEV